MLVSCGIKFRSCIDRRTTAQKNDKHKGKKRKFNKIVFVHSLFNSLLCFYKSIFFLRDCQEFEWRRRRLLLKIPGGKKLCENSIEQHVDQTHNAKREVKMKLKYIIYKDRKYFVARCLDVDVSSFGETILWEPSLPFWGNQDLEKKIFIEHLKYLIVQIISNWTLPLIKS